MIIDLLCKQLERSLSDSPVHRHAETVEEGRDVSITAGESSIGVPIVPFLPALHAVLMFSINVSSSHMTNNI